MINNKDYMLENAQQPMTIDHEKINMYLNSLLESGLAEGTVASYRRGMNHLYDWLPEDKMIHRGSLEQMSVDLLNEGYSRQSVNVFLVAANGLLEFFNRTELQYEKRLEIKDHSTPELTRKEYLRLLVTAKRLGKHQTYMIIKAIAAMGMNTQELIDLHVEHVKNGMILRGNETVRIPACVQSELLSYAEQNQIHSGPVFVSKRGKRMARTNINSSIRALCKAADIAEEKCTPRALKLMHRTTRQNMMKPLQELLEESHERLLEAEQMTVGWDEN